MLLRRLWALFVAAGLVIASLGAVGAAHAESLGLKGSGTGVFWDKSALSDAITITMTGVESPGTGKALEGWLLSDNDATKLSIGVITLGSGGAVNHTYASPTKANLPGLYSKLVITVEPVPDLDPLPAATVAFRYTIPAGAMVHIRHILYQWDLAPNKTGFGIGAREQVQLALTHAKLAQSAARTGSLTSAKAGAEQVVNILEGAKGANYGDLDGSGAVVNPGDGYGALVYLSDAAIHAQLAKNAAPTDAVVGKYGDSAKASYDSVAAFAAQGRDKALSAAKATLIPVADALITDVVNNLTKAVEGFDANANGVVEPIAGEAGVEVAYVESQKIGTFSLTEPSVVGGDVFNIRTLSLIGLIAGLALAASGTLLRLSGRRAAS